MKLGKILFVLFFLLLFSVKAQNLNYAKKIIELLASPQMHGRGYVFKGDSIAAHFIKEEMSIIGLKPFNNNFLQEFTLSVNTLPGKTEVKVNNKPLKPCDDFLIYTPSAGIVGTYKAVMINNKTSQKKIDKLLKNGASNKVIVIDKTDMETQEAERLNAAKFYNIFNAKAVITINNNNKPLTWSVYTGHLLLDFTSLEINKKAFPKKIKKFSFNIQNEYFKNYKTQNVIGYIEGTTYPDSFIVFTSHYDHLGRMGNETYFPGAHDNASGVAMMLDIAAYYSENPPEYSLAFIAIAAEEAGLLGSAFYVKNPIFPLENISFLINLDMVSTGEEGMMVVNGDIFSEEFHALKNLNEQNKYMHDIKSRGEAANSDHYYFYTKGVKSFYFYTLGGYSQYHNIYDIPETLPMYAYNNMFLLITDFIQYLSNPNP